MSAHAADTNNGAGGLRVPYYDFSEAQQALWDAANSSLPYEISRGAVDEVIVECHAKKCNSYHPSNDRVVELIWGAFCEALRLRALALEDGKGTE